MRTLTNLGDLVICLAMATTVSAQSPIPPPQSWSPSLDCNARVYAVDTLICEDVALLKSAQQVEAAYRQALLRPDTQVSLQADQLAWSKQRNMCVFERQARGCVKRLQVQRTKALNMLVNGKGR